MFKSPQPVSPFCSGRSNRHLVLSEFSAAEHAKLNGFFATTMKMYGIKNCDTVKKARAWLDLHEIAYEFIDFKTTSPNADEIARWCHALGVNVVLNRRGTTWKKLTASEQNSADSELGAIAIMVTYPSAIKRPVIESGSDFLIGFDEATYQAQFL